MSIFLVLKASQLVIYASFVDMALKDPKKVAEYSLKLVVEEGVRSCLGSMITSHTFFLPCKIGTVNNGNKSASASQYARIAKNVKKPQTWM